MAGATVTNSGSRATAIVGVGAFLICAGAAFCVAQLGKNSEPFAINPPEIDFGDVNQNQMLDAEFVVTNNRAENLVLDQFQTSCGCITLTMIDEKGQHPIDQDVVLRPGVSARFHSGMAASTSKGPTSGTVSIHTNYASRPKVTFEMKAIVRGGIVSVPASVNVGRIAENEEKTVSVLVTDTGMKEPFVLDRVESTSPLVEVLSASPQTSENIGIPVCSLRLTIKAQEPGPLRASVNVYGKGAKDPNLVVPVAAEVISRWSAAPKAVVFPRKGASDPYSIDVQLLSHNGECGKFTIELPPSWMSVVYSGSEAEGDFKACLTVNPGERSEVASAKLKLVGSTDSHPDIAVTLPVFLRP